MMHPIMTGRWWTAASIRALKTMAQVAVAMIGTETVGVTDVAWAGAASVAAVAGVVSLLTSLAGLPELEPERQSTGRHVRTDDEDVTR